MRWYEILREEDSPITSTDPETKKQLRDALMPIIMPYLASNEVIPAEAVRQHLETELNIDMDNKNNLAMVSSFISNNMEDLVVSVDLHSGGKGIVPRGTSEEKSDNKETKDTKDKNKEKISKQAKKQADKNLKNKDSGLDL